MAGGAWRFPTPARLATASLDEVRRIGLPRARAATVIALARAVAAGPVDLSPTAALAPALAALQRVPGIGPWTAGYLAIRLYRAPDRFLGGDLAARNALGVTSAAAADAAAQRWSPFRSYALMHLWRARAAGG